MDRPYFRGSLFGNMCFPVNSLGSAGITATGVPTDSHFAQLPGHFLIGIQFLYGEGVLKFGDYDGHGEGKDDDSE